MSHCWSCSDHRSKGIDERRWFLAQECGHLKHSCQRAEACWHISFTTLIARRRIDQRRINQRGIDQRRITALDFLLCSSMAIWPYNALAYHCSSATLPEFQALWLYGYLRSGLIKHCGSMRFKHCASFQALSHTQALGPLPCSLSTQPLGLSVILLSPTITHPFRASLTHPFCPPWLSASIVFYNTFGSKLCLKMEGQFCL